MKIEKNSTVKIISDVHANHISLSKALNNVDVDYTFFLGDIIGINGVPSETVKILRENVDVCLKGNHDVSVLEKNEGMVSDKDLSNFELEFTKSDLSESQKEWIKNKKCYSELTIGDKKILLVHAYPEKNKACGIREIPPEKRPKYKEKFGMDVRYCGDYYVEPKDFTKIGSKYDYYDYLFLGHSHKKHHVDCSNFGNDIHVLNPGSIGQDPQSYCIFDFEKDKAHFHEVSINKKDVISDMKKRGVKESIIKDIFN